jgi:hypothetical protein
LALEDEGARKTDSRHCNCRRAGVSEVESGEIDSADSESEGAVASGSAAQPALGKCPPSLTYSWLVSVLSTPYSIRNSTTASL